MGTGPHIKSFVLGSLSSTTEQEQEKSRVLIKVGKRFLMVFISPSDAIYANRSRTWGSSIVNKNSPQPSA